MNICLSCEGVAAAELDRCAHCSVTLVPTSAAHFPLRRGEADATNPLVGTVIDGKFLIQGVLGRGGMGTVFRACHTVSLVPVALKLLHPRLSVRTEYRRSLLAEARKAGRVVHDQCARVIDVGETEEGTVYLAMELAEGEPLDALVRGAGLAPSVAVDVLVQICRALVAIHSAGLVHRDLSSRNVMVAVRDGRPLVKVLDFGIAQSLRLAPAAAEEGAGEQAFANPVFSAPEHLAGQDVDARADLYSLGVLAYQLLTGRLPVDEHDGRAAVRATVAGQLRPMGPVPGVPRRLVRLVQRCLELDRQRRPAAAAAVLDELERLTHGRLPWLARTSLFVFAATVAVAIATFARTTPPFLLLVGSTLPFSEGSLAPTAPVTFLRSSALGTLTAHYGGFPAGRLEIVVGHANQVLLQRRLQPHEQRDGTLVLSAAQPDWQQAVLGITRASVDAPVDVSFVVPGLAVLGSVRLRIDDAPPQLAMQVVGRTAGQLDRTSIVQLQCHDDAGIAQLRLVLRLPNGNQQFPLQPTATEFALGQALAEIYGATPPLGEATLDLVGEDLAGNRSAHPPLEFATCDFGAPAVVGVTGPTGEAAVPHLDDRARVRLRLDVAEAGLSFAVRDPDGRERRIASSTPGVGPAYELELLARSDGEPFANDIYTFVVTDAAGNTSESTHRLVFRSERIDPVFANAGGEPAEITGEEIVVGPQGARLAFACNATFAPTAVRLRATGATAAATAVPGPAVREGERFCFTVPPLPRGSYELEVGLEAVGAARTADVPIVRRLTVLPERLVVRLPEGGHRYLPGLVDANLFVVANGQLLQGAAISLEPELRRFVRGRLWGGADHGALAPHQPLRDGSDDPSLLPPVQLLRGRNVLAVELRDVLGRAVAVTCGDRPAPQLHLDGRDLWLLADFFDDPTQPQLIGGDQLLVEYGQSLAVRLRCNVPFVVADLPRLQLAVRSAQVDATSVTTLDGGSEVAFVLKYPVWSTAADLGDLPRASYARGTTAALAARLLTPAGPYALDLVVRTARSTLQTVQVLDLGERTMPPALGSIAMVPVLAPESGTFEDPVPEHAAARDLYRPQPPQSVRGMADVFLQDREFTLAQYAAVLGALPRLAARRAAIVHADDPLGAGRLEQAAMVPAAWRGDQDAFAAAVAAEPEAAVAGLDFFQAYTAARAVGVLCVGDADLFRLPLGCELELAAFGSAVPGAARNGPAAQGRRVRADAWRGRESTTPVGPTADTATRCGDFVASMGQAICSLDFGLREWVLDLPQGVDTGGESLLREWIGDRDRHVKRALELAGARPAPPGQSGLGADLQARLRTYGVVRGLPYGQLDGLLDENGRPLALLGLQFLPADVPGVVRTEQLRRDGRDLMAGRVDPRLAHLGFRLCGGDVFVARARGR